MNENNGSMPIMPSLVVPEQKETEANEIKKPEYESKTNIISNSVKKLNDPKDGIEVVALRRGFYNNNRINEGQKFTVSKFENLGEWMKCVDKEHEKEKNRLFDLKRQKRKKKIIKEE